MNESNGLEKDPKRKTRVAAYARVSTSEQEKRHTIQIQVEELTQTIKERGWELVDRYVDNGYSGTLQERPGIDRLLAEIKEKTIDVVLVTEPDRLARIFVLQKLFESEIEEKNARVEYLSMPPAKTDDEQLGVDVRGLVSAWLRGYIKRKTNAGKIEKAKKGFVVGGKAPYGFRYVARTRETQSHYEPIEDELRWVREMFNWCARESLSVDAIALRLIDRKVPTQSGNRIWRGSTVHHMLTNETYAGVAHYLKHRSIPPKNREKSVGYRRFKNISRELRPKDKWIPIPLDLVIDRETFIDRETWDRAQLQLKRNARSSSRNTRHPYLLRGRTFCGLCELPCYGSVSRSSLRYQCSNRHYKSPLPKTCFAKSVSASVLDSVVWETVSQAVANHDVFLPQLRELQDDEAKKVDYHRGELERLKNRLEKLDKAEERAAELYARDEGMGFKQYKDHVDKIRNEKETLRKEKKELQRRIGKTVDWEHSKKNIKFLDAYIKSKVEKLSFEDKQRIIGLLVDRVIINGNHVRIEGAIPPMETANANSSKDVVIASNSSPSQVQIHTNWYKLVR